MNTSAMALTFALLCATPLALAQSLHWPNDERAAVSLSYDDALHSQLNYAVPTLNEHGIKASFYPILSSPVVQERMGEWRDLAEAGHELGNHTLFHACSGSAPNRDWVPPHKDLDKRSVEQMQEEVATANAFLQALDGRSKRTMTPPCLEGETRNGNYLEAVQDQFVAIKGVEQTVPKAFSQFLLPEGQSGEELIKFVESAAEKGGLIQIVFHGVGGDHLSVSAEAHEALIRYLAEHRDHYWTDTYLNIMSYVNTTVPASSSIER